MLPELQVFKRGVGDFENTRMIGKLKFQRMGKSDSFGFRLCSPKSTASEVRCFPNFEFSKGRVGDFENHPHA